MREIARVYKIGQRQNNCCSTPNKSAPTLVVQKQGFKLESLILAQNER